MHLSGADHSGHSSSMGCRPRRHGQTQLSSAPKLAVGGVPCHRPRKRKGKKRKIERESAQSSKGKQQLSMKSSKAPGLALTSQGSLPDCPLCVGQQVGSLCTSSLRDGVVSGVVGFRRLASVASGLIELVHTTLQPVRNAAALRPMPEVGPPPPTDS